MPTRINWLIRVFLTAVLMTTGFATAAYADSSVPEDSHTPGATYTAPAPSKLNPAGTDQDRFCIPEAYFEGVFQHPWHGSGQYSVNGQVYPVGCHETGGASSITVMTDYDSGTWTFYYPDAPIGPEAENSYSVVVGDTCHTTFEGTYREVTAYFTNELDGSEPEEYPRYINSIFPRAVSVPAENDAYATDEANIIADGATAVMKIKIFDDLPGLVPGTWNVSFWRSDSGHANSLEGYVVKQLQISVPPCEDAEPEPEPEPVSGKATGDLRKLTCMKVGVTASARNFWAQPFAKYRIIKYMAGRKVSQRDFTVAARTVKKFTVYQPLRKPNRRAKTELRVRRGDRFVWVDSVSRCRR